MSRRKRRSLVTPEILMREDFFKCGEPFTVSDVRSRFSTTKDEVMEVIHELLELGKVKPVENLLRPPGPAYKDAYVKYSPEKDLLRRAWK